MYKLDTCTFLLTAVAQELIAEKFDLDFLHISLYPDKLHQAILEQQFISWDKFMTGLISMHWENIKKLTIQILIPKELDECGFTN